MIRRPKAPPPLSHIPAGHVSRREFLALGSIGLVVASGLGSQAQAQTAAFDFYISPTGNDSNAGTVSSPWAITSLMAASQTSRNVANFNAIAGKRLGLLPGIYNVASYIQPDSHTGALQIPGGTASASTYIGSSDSSGNYSARTATITALNGSVFGGRPGYTYNGPILANTGGSYNSGYFTLDGLVISGFSYKGVRIGGNSSGDGPANVQRVIVQNCQFTGGGHNSGDATDNSSALWLDYTIGAVVQNNYFLNNIGFNAGNADHLAAIICWGCQGSQIGFNSMVNAGYIWGKENANQGNNVFNNYVDCSMYTAQSSANGIQDFTGANTSGLTQTTNIHHNILLSTGFGLGYATLSQNYGWTTPVNFYNNTIIMVQAGGLIVEAAVWMFSQISGNVKLYNNILAGVMSGDYGAIRFNANGPSVWDYNLVPSAMTWKMLAGSSGSTQTGAYTSLSSVQAAVVAAGGISTFDAHTLQSSNPGFVGAGTMALQYQLTSGAAAANAGRVGGVPSGAICNIGAWDGTVTQVGSSLNGGAIVLPDPPSNVTVS
jgi:hypothetical protein